MDALKFCLPWVGNYSGAERVIIYTDEDSGDYSHRPDVQMSIPVEYRPHFNKSSDWLENVGRLPLTANDYVHRAKEGQKFVLNGADCIFVRDVSMVFDEMSNKRWLGLYRLDSLKKTIPNIFFAIVNDRCREMVDAWMPLSACMQECNIGTMEGYVAYDQISFDFLVLSVYLPEVFGLKDKVLMNETDDLDNWKSSVGRLGEGVYGLHFKGGRWKDEKLVKEILALAKVV
jgi:hypothetical protein